MPAAHDNVGAELQTREQLKDMENHKQIKSKYDIFVDAIFDPKQTKVFIPVSLRTYF